MKTVQILVIFVPEFMGVPLEYAIDCNDGKFVIRNNIRVCVHMYVQMFSVPF